MAVEEIPEMKATGKKIILQKRILLLFIYSLLMYFFDDVRSEK